MRNAVDHGVEGASPSPRSDALPTRLRRWCFGWWRCRPQLLELGDRLLEHRASAEQPHEQGVARDRELVHHHQPGSQERPSWGPIDPPIEDEHYVFEYRLALPALLEVITLRLLIADLTGLSDELHQSPWDGVMKRLQDVHDKILTNMVSTYPRVIEINDPDKIWFGAVEIHSGVAVQGSYSFPPLFKDGAVWPPAHGLLMKRLSVLALKARKDLYRMIGMSSVLRAINHLRKLGGQPPSAQLDYGAWSLREVGQLHYRVTLGDPYWEDFEYPLLDAPPITLRAVASALADPDAKQPATTISLRNLFEG